MEILDLENQLIVANENLTTLAHLLKASAEREARLNSDYQNLKNSFLIYLYAEEVKTATKRTEAQRMAMYRHKYAEERLNWLLAKADHESNNTLFKGLSTKISAIQSLINIEREKMKLI